MESPDTCWTNVLKRDGFSHIRYHVYIPTNRRPNPGHGIPASASSASRSNAIALRRGEKHIRELGVLGVTDLRSGELWVFDTDITIRSGLSVGIYNDRMQGEIEGCKNRTPRTPQNLGFPPSWGLRILREGIFQPHCVNNTGTPILENVPPGNNSSSSNNLISGDVLPSSEQLPSSSLQSDPYNVIYKHFIMSILETLTYAISKSSAGGRRYIPLNFNTLIQIQENYTPISASPTSSDYSLPTPPLSARMHGSDRGEGHGRGALLMFSLTAYLTSSGTLCIIPTGKKSSGLDSMTSLVSSTDRDSTLESRDVWIAPWGRVGRVRELISSNSKAPGGMKWEELQWAAEVRQYLLERGVQPATDEEQWARIDVWLDEDEGSERLQTIVWPVSLCFIRLSESDNYSLLHRKQEIQSQVESVGLKLSGQGTPVSTDDSSNDDERLCESTTFSRNIFADYEWVTLGGLVSSPHGGALPLQDPGVIWFSSSILDPVEFAEKWKMSAEERLEIIKLRREKEAEKQKIMEAESLKRRVEFLHMEQEKNERELKGGVVDIKREAASVVGSVSGVYSTPPDGQAPANISTTEILQELAPPDPTSAVSMDASSLPLTLDNDIDIDWSGAGGPMSLDGSGNAVGKSSATDGLASIAAYLGDDLVEGDDDIFAAEVTDKDFDFFDEPGFGDPLDSRIGLTEAPHQAVGSTTDMIGHSADTNIISMALDSSHLENIDFGGMHNVGISMDICSTTPMISKMDFSSSAPLGPLNNIVQPIDNIAPVKHIQTPPLSPQRAMKLLLPQYAKHWSFCNAHPDPPQLTTPNNENASHLGWNCDDLNNPAPRRPSIYSPLTFLPGIEMVDKKYMEGGRFFGLPPKEEKLEFLDGQLASISLLDTPLSQRASSKRTLGSAVTTNPSETANRSHPTEPTIEEIHMGEDDRDSDESEYEYNENESSESDVDEESDTEYSLPPLPDSSPVFTTGHKRKRAVDDDGDLALTESEYGTGIPILQVDKSDSGETTTAIELAPPPWQSMVPNPEDYCLVDIFEMSSTDNSTHHDFWGLSRMSDTEYHSVIKIVARQIATGSPFHRRVYHGVGNFMFEEETGNENLEKRRRLSGERQVEEIIKDVLDGVARCTLETYAAIPDAPVETATLGKTGFRPIAQPRRAGKQLATPSESSILIGDLYSSTVTFKMPPPHVHVHRAETVLEISPVALKFWETFGFGPCSGPKNVIGFCIFPAGDAMVDAVDDFMERVGATYDSCRLGSYVRGNIDDISGGMMGVQLPLRQTGELELGPIMQSIRDACMRLGSMLTSIADEQQNIVIYLVNPFSKDSLIPDLCYAFSQLNHAYSTAISQLHNAIRNNVVLQVVPIDFIIVKNGLVAAPQTEYIQFALEVYNRCMPTDNASSVEEVSSAAQSPLWSREKVHEQKEIYSPSIILAKPVPKAITFQFSPEPVNPLLQGGSCIHVAYRQSLDERWAAFAWTDNYGEIQFFETYCLGRKGCTGLRLWEDVARDVWKKTMECIKKRNMTPRVCLTRVEGWVNTDELDLWVSLAAESTQQYTTNSQTGPLSQSSITMRNNGIILTILIADTAPALSLIPSLPIISPQAFNPHSSLFTPVSTPNANMLSPDLSGTSTLNTNTAGGTPSADTIPELDPDAQLIDYADEIWGVILSHKLPISPVMVEARPSLVSGFLVKRGAIGLEGGEEPVVMGVSLVGGNCSPGPTATGGQARKQVLEAQLKEVMCQWRGLSILAQHKGVVEETGSVLPWHVAVVHKVIAGLEVCGI